MIGALRLAGNWICKRSDPLSQFWSKWVAETATTWSDSYKVKDLDIASLTIQQSENSCATLTVVVRNPQVGLLAPGRLVWLWLAWEDDLGTTTPLFFGRLMPVPGRGTNFGEGATLSFVARPLDFDTQKAELALSMQVAPYYDPIFIDAAKRLSFSTTAGDYVGDPDTVLEGWSSLWHVDRVTGEVTASDILDGEDGTEVFLSSEIPEASVQINVSSSVLTDVTVVGKVNWTQSGGGGSFPVSIAATVPNGLDLYNQWPKAGSTLAGGYAVESSLAVDWQGLSKAEVVQKGWRYENKAKQHQAGDVISISWNYAEFPRGLSGPSYLISETVQQASAPQLGDHLGISQSAEPNLPFHFNANILVIAEVPMSATMQLGPSASLSRNETITIKLAADIQPLISIPTTTTTPSQASPITVNGSDVGVPINGTAPISGAQASNFFPTTRGTQALEYLISIGVAHLKSANRAVQISWDTTFDRAIALSCRKNATINARLIPGGAATGKIISYTIAASGPDMQLKGNVTIGCCIGNGATGTVTGSSGTDILAVPGTFVSGVSTATGSSIVVGGNTAGGDISFAPPIYAPQAGEPTFPLQRSQCVISESFVYEQTFVNTSRTVLPDGSPGPYVQVGVPIAVFELELLDLSGQFGTTYDLTTTPLKLPKQIDLTVPSW